MFRLIYTSLAKQNFSIPELKELLKKARAFNAENGICGLLAYEDYNFIQILEGSQEAVWELMSRIKKDPRHTLIIVLLAQTIPKKQFANWDMDFIGKDELEQLPSDAFYQIKQMVKNSEIETEKLDNFINSYQEFRRHVDSVL